MNQPFFSCVMAVKGPRPYWDEACSSLLTQNMGDDLEIIIQDGDVEPDNGLSDAFNKGLAKCRGEWLFWLNADDILLPGTLAKVRAMVRRMEERGKSIEWISGGSKFIDKEGRVIGRKFDRRFHVWLYKHMWVWTCGPSSFFRRSLWEKCGGMDTQLKCMMDMDLWTRWAREGHQFQVLPDFAWGFRVHDGSITSGGCHQEWMAQDMKIVSDRYQFRHGRFWLFLQRLSRVLDGSAFKR